MQLSRKGRKAIESKPCAPGKGTQRTRKIIRVDTRPGEWVTEARDMVSRCWSPTQSRQASLAGWDMFGPDKMSAKACSTLMRGLHMLNSPKAGGREVCCCGCGFPTTSFGACHSQIQWMLWPHSLHGPAQLWIWCRPAWRMDTARGCRSYLVLGHGPGRVVPAIEGIPQAMSPELPRPCQWLLHQSQSLTMCLESVRVLPPPRNDSTTVRR